MTFQKKALFLAVLLTFSVLFPLIAGQAAHAAPNPRYASIVMDARTGMILSQSHADKILHPASLTKIMTLVMVFDALERRDLRLTSRIRVSRHAAGMVPSKLDLRPGETIRVEDAILALVTKSANDVAAALAEAIGGSEERFAMMMTRKARSIGMSRTRFRNASGLHDPRQVSTARDMAILGRYVWQNYPDYYPYFSARSFTYKGTGFRNHNRLMRSYDGMDGIKTGYVQASGFNLVASAKRGNTRLVGVVFGGRTAKSRNAHMRTLLDRGFEKSRTILMASAAPVPLRKPDFEQDQDQDSVRWAALNTGMIGALIGQGDYDPAVTRRFETGLLAIAAHSGENFREARRKLTPVVVSASLARTDQKPAGYLTAPTETETSAAPVVPDSWTIQVGAFGSRVTSDDVLRDALQALPQDLIATGRPLVSPIRTENGLIYRARLTGFSRENARRACSFFDDCVTLPPQL